MLIIFDLDYTLLDTENFKKGLSEALGLSIEEFNDSYKKYFKDNCIPYNIEKHTEYLTQDTAQTEKFIKARLKSFFSAIDKYLFSDSKIVLEKLKLGGHKLFLLTFGDMEWQKMKIENLKIKKYFDEIIYTDKEKGEVAELRNMAEGRKDILIVNDNAKECLDIRETLGCGEIFLIDGPYANNCKHNLKIRKLRDLI